MIRIEIPKFQPEPIDNEWFKWLIGEWKILGKTEWIDNNFEDFKESEIEKPEEGRAIIEFKLNSQFLIIKSEGKIPEMTDEQIQNLKESTQASDEEIKRFVSSPFKSLQIFTISPNTGEIIGYLFDSLRSIAEGKGKMEGNKLIIKWKWHSLGQGAKSRQTRERVGNDKLIIKEEFTMPDGKIMKEMTIMTRIKKTTKV
jgi:hypothetical protein